MAITTYSELQTAAANWLDRADLTARIPEFIALAEADINSVFDLRTIESDQALTLTQGSRLAPLPAAFREAQNLWQVWPTTGARVSLRMVPPELQEITAINSIPTAWGIDGTNIAFNCPLQSATAYSYVLRMIGGVALSDASPTNLILTNYPNVYLFGALKEASPYLRDGEAMQVWDAKYQDALKKAMDKEHRAKALVTLSTEPGVLANMGRRSGFNINRGW